MNGLLLWVGSFIATLRRVFELANYFVVIVGAFSFLFWPAWSASFRTRLKTVELERDRLSHEITKVGFKNSQFFSFLSTFKFQVSKPADRSFVDQCLVIMLMLKCHWGCTEQCIVYLKGSFFRWMKVSHILASSVFFFKKTFYRIVFAWNLPTSLCLAPFTEDSSV